MAIVQGVSTPISPFPIVYDTGMFHSYTHVGGISAQPGWEGPAPAIDLAVAKIQATVQATHGMTFSPPPPPKHPG